MRYLCAPLVKSWNERGLVVALGCEFGAQTEDLVNLIILAGGLWILAQTVRALQIMTSELIRVLHGNGLTWKVKSLKVRCSAGPESMPDGPQALLSLAQDGEISILSPLA